MIKTILIIVSWLQAGPIIQTQTFESTDQCNVVAEATAQMIKGQAQSNMTSPHNQLSVSREEKTGEWKLTTGVVGREVARLRCTNTDLN